MLLVLARFPNWMAPWKHGLGQGQGRGRPFFYALAEEAATNTNSGQCYVKKLFDEAPKHSLSKMEISSLSGNLFGAGSDTSSSTLVTFVLACCAFPKALTKAREELDRIVGPHRSPTFQDEADLPYVKALMKEVLRWRSVAIIGGQPHAPIKDDHYKVLKQATFVTLEAVSMIDQFADKMDLGLVDPAKYLGPRQCLGHSSP